jgi:hypothetical protein
MGGGFLRILLLAKHWENTQYPDSRGSAAAESSERIAAANTLAFLVNMVNHHVCVMFACYLRVSGRYL